MNMKKAICLMIGVALLAITGLGATLSWYGVITFDTATQIVTISKPVAIEATDPSTIPSLESGTSTYAINASGTVSTFNRIYTLNLATDTTLKLDSLTDVNVWVIYKNTTTAGNAGGVTVWSVAQQIRDGVGSARTSGNTIFVNGGVSGNSGWEIALKALSYGGTLGWEVESCNATVRRP